MRVCGVVAEYNPFHNGHAWQLARAREEATHLVVVMSGSFVQRGEPALLSKWVRAKAALTNGADLVLELPAVYACSSAERFAIGAIGLLQALGCVELVSFGSESGDLDALYRCARLCAEIDQQSDMHAQLKQGVSYPKARQNALGDAGVLLEQPNNTLAIEYIKAAMRLHAPFAFHTVKRQAPHDGGHPFDGFASGSYLRAHNQWEGLVPLNCQAIYAQALRSDVSSLEPALLYRLRTTTAALLAQLPDVTEGLENRLYACGRRARTMDEFFSMVKTKRYTHSRLRRILCHLLLGSTKQDLASAPAYARVLGSNARGLEVLKACKQTAVIPVSADFTQLAKQAPRQALLDCRATDLFALTTTPRQPAGMDFTEQPVMLLED